MKKLAQDNGVANPDVIDVGQHLHVNDTAVREQSAHVRVEAPRPKTEPRVQREVPAQKQPSQAPVSDNNSAKNTIMQRESGGDPNAVNPSSGAVGLFQCMPSVHQCPAAGDAAGQSAWADKYVAERYGSWDAALAYWNANGNY